jgi:hypothetical protein
VAEEGDVLVLNVNEMIYDAVSPDDLFALDVPDDAIWHEYPGGPPTDNSYAVMEPDQAAPALLEALANEHGESVLRFADLSEIPEEVKPCFGGLEIIRPGDPFQSGQCPGWSVPYEIRLTLGQVIKHDLAIRNDNPVQRWLVGGGIWL